LIAQCISTAEICEPPSDQEAAPSVAKNGMDRLDGEDPAEYRLPAIPYLRLRVTLRAGRSGRLPGFKGSLLRGAIGHALRRTVCAFGPEAPCPACPLRAVCPYPRIFEPRIGEGEAPPVLKGLTEAPRPYVFEPAGEARGFRPGDALGFDLVLLRQAAELHAYALVAVERMAAAGLGEERIPFTLDEAQGWDGGRGTSPLAQGGRLLPGVPLEPAVPSEEPLPDGPVELFAEAGVERAAYLKAIAELSFAERLHLVEAAQVYHRESEEGANQLLRSCPRRAGTLSGHEPASPPGRNTGAGSSPPAPAPPVHASRLTCLPRPLFALAAYGPCVLHRLTLLLGCSMSFTRRGHRTARQEEVLSCSEKEVSPARPALSVDRKALSWRVETIRKSGSSRKETPQGMIERETMRYREWHLVLPGLGTELRT
jgi:hypothetical protein